MDPDGNGGEFPCPNQVNDANAVNATLSQMTRLSLSQVNRSSNSPGGSSNGHNLPRDISVMLRVSPESAGSSFGYIYLAIDECIHQEPLLTFFNNAGRTVHILPCPDFDVFLWSNFIGARNTLFITDLPPYIIPDGVVFWRITSSQRTWRPTSPGSQTFL